MLADIDAGSLQYRAPSLSNVRARVRKPAAMVSRSYQTRGAIFDQPRRKHTAFMLSNGELRGAQEPLMARSQSRLTAEIDFNRNGKQHGFI